MTDPVKEMAAQLRQLTEEKAAEVRNTPEFAELMKLHRSLNGLETGMGETPTPLGQFFGLAIDSTQAAPATRGNAQAVRVDEFFSMDALDAAKAYIKKHRDARPFQEIISAIRGGGAKIENEDKLRTGLGRSTLDVVKFGDHYGWLDNYPEEKAKRTKGLRRTPMTDEAKKEKASAETVQPDGAGDVTQS